jgi:CRP/FNR family transcriptional regulator, cyclic AMP receptor protein
VGNINRGPRADLDGLMRATRKNKSRDSLAGQFDELTWIALSEFLVPQVTEYKQLVITQGAKDRNLYFVESGMLRVYRAERDSRLQLAVLGPGSVVGEGTFFAPIVRNANVEAVEASVLWELTPERFAALAERYSEAAYRIAMGLGAVLSVRMLSVAGRLAIT